VSGVLVLLAVNVVLGFAFPGIDWRAHLGGLVVGAVLTAAFVYPSPRARVVVGWGAVAGILVLLAWAVSWRTDQLLLMAGVVA
jgi:hypothetical protein